MRLWRHCEYDTRLQLLKPLNHEFQLSYSVLLSLFTPTSEIRIRPSWVQWAESKANGTSQSGCFLLSVGLCFQRRHDTAWRFRLLFWDLLHNSIKKQQVTLRFLSSWSPFWAWRTVGSPQTRNREHEEEGGDEEAKREQNWPRSRCHLKNLIHTHNILFTSWPSVGGSGKDIGLESQRDLNLNLTLPPACV